MPMNASEGITFAALAALLASCAPSGSSEAGWVVCADSAATVEAARMAAALTPSQAAVSLAGWMVEAPLSQAAFVHELYAGLRRAYADDAPRLDASLDSLFALQEPAAQARMVVLSASPERAAAALVADSTVVGLIPIVEQIYADEAPDSLMLRRFQNALPRKQSN